MKQISNRLEYIDTAKGICISLVLLFHIHNFGTDVGTFIGAFRMPLYYFLSGLFFKQYCGFKDFGIRKINNLIVPYFFFYLIAYFAGFVCHLMRFYEKGIIQEPFEWNMLFDIITCAGKGEHISYNSPIWFLLSLFETNVIFYVIRKSVKNSVIIMLICCIIGCLSLIFELDSLPYYLDKTFISLPYFAFGYLMKPVLLNKDYRESKKIVLLKIIILGAVGYLCAIMYADFHSVFVLRYIAAFSGIMFIIYTSKIIDKLPILTYIGRYSLVVLGFHTFFVGPFRYIFLFGGVLFQYIMTYITIILLMRYIIIPCSIRFFPKFVAQKDLFKNKYRKMED